MQQTFYKLLFTILSIVSATPSSALRGKLDLGSPPRGYIMRDASNGQFRGGYDKSLFQLVRNDKELLYLGYTNTWNAEHGNPAAGLSVGKHVKVSDFGVPLNLDGLTLPPFVKYLDKVTSINVAGAYMPIHTQDVNGPFIWGFGVDVDLSDIFQILSKGL